MAQTALGINIGDELLSAALVSGTGREARVTACASAPLAADSPEQGRKPRARKTSGTAHATSRDTLNCIRAARRPSRTTSVRLLAAASVSTSR